MTAIETTPSASALLKLLRLMADLRDPEHGCAWDKAQTFSTIAPYTIEEAYEVADAIARQDHAELKQELGDLLLQVVFHARIAEEASLFRFENVVEAIVAKLIRRHPHVFDAEGRVLAEPSQPDEETVGRIWEQAKAQERGGQANASPLSGVARALPALLRAEKLSRKAADYGFDWPEPREVLAKVREEVDEVEEAMGTGDPVRIDEELGDLLFSVANLGRHFGISTEYSLSKGNEKFERRFLAMAEKLVTEGRSLGEADLPAMEAAWAAVKRDEAR
jgi:ATP diphosphatase